MESVRIYEIPACQMVSSKCSMFGEGPLEQFEQWFSALPRSLFPRDYLWFDEQKGGFCWYYIYEETMEVPADFELVEFIGGLYAVASDIDNQDNTEVLNAIRQFIADKGCFAEDPTRPYMGNIPTPPSAAEAMGYCQMDYYIPIRVI